MPALRHRRPIAWLAILAVLVAALAPSVSRALVAHFDGGAAPWLALCTAQGIKFVKADGSATNAPDHERKSRFEHCPLCPLQAAGSAPLPVLGLTFAVPDGKPVVPAAFLHAAPAQHVWTAAHARGPPTLS